MMDEALEFLAPYGPDLANGLTNHAPMASEALVAMGRADAVMPWLEGYRRGLVPRTAAHGRIARDGWREALGREELFPEWNDFMAAELGEVPWREVLARWTARLSPAICASAMHGVIRVAHAARSLATEESPARVRELGEGLAYWAAAYQVLPTASGGAGMMRPREAIAAVPIVPENRRRFTGTIVASLAALDEFPEFAPVIGMIAVEGDPSSLISQLTETFASVYLANAPDVLGSIIFTHGVTGAAALRSLVPHLPDSVARDAIRHAWQAGCALYAAFGKSPGPAAPIEAPRESWTDLVELAIANGDEHAIKLTGACLGEHALNPVPAYPAAVRHALDVLAND